MELRDVAGWKMILERMEEQNKGLLRMAKLTNTSTTLIRAIKNGKSCKISTLTVVLEELGLELVIRPKEGATPQYLEKHKKGMPLEKYLEMRQVSSTKMKTIDNKTRENETN